MLGLAVPEKHGRAEWVDPGIKRRAGPARLWNAAPCTCLYAYLVGVCRELHSGIGWHPDRTEQVEWGGSGRRRGKGPGAFLLMLPGAELYKRRAVVAGARVDHARCLVHMLRARDRLLFPND